MAKRSKNLEVKRKMIQRSIPVRDIKELHDGYWSFQEIKFDW